MGWNRASLFWRRAGQGLAATLIADGAELGGTLTVPAGKAITVDDGGVIELPDGDVAAPSVRATSAPTTGWFYNAVAGEIQESASGVGRAPHHVVTHATVAAGDTIECEADESFALFTVVNVNQTATVTHSAAVRMSAGAYDGQLVILRNVGTNTLTLTDGGGMDLASGTNKALSANDLIGFLWRASTSTWQQVTTLQAI